MTPNIYAILYQQPWWSTFNYKAFPPPQEVLTQGAYFTALLWRESALREGRCAALPFESIMGRDLKQLTARHPHAPICIATSHLESPTGWNKMYSQSRVKQCQEAVRILDMSPLDVVFVGDMNWSEQNDGVPPLPSGWIDAWAELHPGEAGYTYDTVANPMLGSYKRPLRRRLDRAFMRLRKWEVAGVDMVGQEEVLGVRFEGKPVLPSDHYGLLIKLKAKE